MYFGHKKYNTVDSGKTQKECYGGNGKVQSISETEHELEAVLLCIGIPVGPVPISCVIRLVFDFASGDTECNCLVWFSRNLWALISA